MPNLWTWIFDYLVLRGGFLGLLVIPVFLLAYYFLYKRRDEQTAVELGCIAWLMTLCSVGMGIRDSFITMSGIPKWWAIQLVQYEVFTSILVLPTCLTIPMAWTLLSTESDLGRRENRWLFIAVAIGFLDILLYLAILAPACLRHLFPLG